MDINKEVRSLYQSGKYYVSLPKAEKANYEESYWNTIVDPDGKERNRLEERDLFLSDINYAVTYLNTLPPGKVLDIGCGLGWLLSALPEAWEKHGIELSKTAATFAQQYGKIFEGPLSASAYLDNSFDVIFIHHVIEHMEKPEEEIKNIKRILKPDGILILGTPDFDSGCARLFGENYRLLHDETHISLFSNDSIHRFLRDNDFEIFRVEYPFFKTRFFTKENLMKLFNTNTISPPFYGNFMTFFCKNKKV
ncbi:MAG: class I SAM-dependent methyltransferase [bacterium]|nr:class I SAM-dependent methyltransferase [bacterium]